MGTSEPTDSIIRFERFELNLQSGELRKDGTRVKLQDQPFRILVALLRYPNQVVTREELRRLIWPQQTIGDFDHALNLAVTKLRSSLGDSATVPHLIETLPRRGYRFIGPIDHCAVPTEPSEQLATRAAPAGLKQAAHWRRAVVLGSIIASICVLVGTWHLWSSARRASQIDSIAVLPFVNEGGDPEQQYFADGMTEALITELSKIGSLEVISRTSVMRFKGTTKPLPMIARELDVDGIVEGSVLRSGKRVRITAQLVRASSDTHLWAQSYEGDLGDVLILQGKVAQAIADEISAKVTPQERSHLANTRPVNPEAYEFYLKGRYEWNKRTEDGLRRGVEFFQQAINLAPAYALPYAGMSDCYAVLANNSRVAGRDVYADAKASALKALELDPTSSEAHASLGLVLFQFDRDYQGALKELRTAINFNPNYATARYFYGFSLAEMGQIEEAVREIEQARRLDPLSVRINANIALVFYFGRQYDQAIIQARRALELEPNDSATHDRLGDIYLQKGMTKEALAEFHLVSNSDSPVARLVYVYSAEGNKAEALKALEKLKEQSRRGYVSPYYLARAYTALGMKDEALAWLQKGVDTFSGGMDRLKVEPAFDPLRSDPRFQELLKRMNFSQ